MKEVPDTHWAWLGALVDGEGTITCVFRNYEDRRNVRPRICVYNTQRVILDAIVDRFGVGRIYTHNRAFKENQKLTAYEWRANNAEMRWILPRLRSWLILKGGQCDLVMRVLAAKEQLRPMAGRTTPIPLNDEIRRCAEEVQLLNRKGLRKTTTAMEFGDEYRLVRTR